MSRLTSDGHQTLADICRRHGVSEDAGLVLLDELARNNGTMAQFNLPELGGSGQWMAGGMTMVGDMFNYGLKARVDGLCQDLVGLLATGPFRPAPAPQQSSRSNVGVSVFAGVGAGSAGQWWPAELGQPNWQGSQNAMRYAYFAGSNRLALDVNGTVSVHDTTGFTLTGVSQQQSSGSGSSLTFTGPGGLVTLDRLRQVDMREPASMSAPEPPTLPSPAPTPEPKPEPERVPEPATAPAGEPDPADGLTRQRWQYHGPDGTAPIAMTFAADGVLRDTGTQTLTYWELEGDVLTLFAGNGRATARFANVTGENRGADLTGTSPPGSGTRVLLRRMTTAVPPPETTPEPGATILELRCDLTKGTWLFAQDGGEALATLSLRPDGGISGHTRPTESGWRLEGAAVVFLHRSGRPTTRFAAVTVEDGVWTLRGVSLADKRTEYVLRQG